MNSAVNFIGRGCAEPIMVVTDLILDNPPVFIKPSRQYGNLQFPVVEEFQIARLSPDRLSLSMSTNITFVMRNVCRNTLLKTLFDEIYNDTFSIVSKKFPIVSNDIRKNIDSINIEGGVQYVSEISKCQSEEEKRSRKDSLRGYGQVGPYRSQF